jgi:hypothetical protein
VNGETLLRFAYAFNILVLVPVVTGLLLHRGPGLVAALGGNIVNSDGLRWLLISLWGGVAVASLLGLYLPRLFVPLLVFQVIYKSIFLAGYVLPAAVRGDWNSIPLGPSAVFLFIILTWPLLIARAL